jgi:cytochrome P450
MSVSGTSTHTPAICPFDHHDKSLKGDELFAVYRDVRPKGIVRSCAYGGFWMVSGYDDARAALKDHQLFSSAGGCFLPDLGYRNKALEQDPPDHGPFRKLFTTAVGRGAVLGRESDLDAMITDVVEGFVKAGGGDARAELSEKIPVEAIALMFGLSRQTASRLRSVTTEAWARFDKDPNAAAPILELLMTEVDRRRETPGDDFITLLTKTLMDDSLISDDDIANVLVGGVVAGHETTMNASSNLVRELASSKALQEQLRDHPEDIPDFVDECLRHRAPVHVFFRTVTRDAAFGGVEMIAGDKVAILYASANRDGAKFLDPERFDPKRDGSAHLSFGWGIHRCAGAFLAQTELRLLTQRLLERATLSLAGPPEEAPLEGGHHMGLRRLEVVTSARS